ncbi:MAG: GDP-mannose 4,6-dehydratase [Candidatus Micrarchaeota archaeon]
MSHTEAQGRGVRISISQSFISNENKHKKINDILKKLKYNFRERNRNDGVTEWIFDAETSKKVLQLFDSPNMHIAPRYLFTFSQRQSKILFTALMDCDGHWGALTYSSKRYLLATDFQTIAHLAGYRTSSITMNGDNYVVSVISDRKNYTYIQEIEKNNDGIFDVWCVNTGNGTIITRDQDCIFISGNCEAMWLILQHKTPEDFVVATGESHSVKEFLVDAFTSVGLNWQDYVKIDPRYFRPTEVDFLKGDASKAHELLGWKPKVSFKELVKMMVEEDMKKEGVNTNVLSGK